MAKSRSRLEKRQNGENRTAPKNLPKSEKAAKKPVENPALAGVRPPPPGQGKRGEKGYLAYLLRQAQAATRLTLERALADLGVTPPQFAVLTMLKAYPGLSGADLARVALLTPQTVGVIIRNLERDGAIQKKTAPGARPGAAMDADPARTGAARQMPGARQSPGPPAAGGARPEGASDRPALAVQNCRRPAAGWLVVAVL